jgi:hypothetical protein
VDSIDAPASTRAGFHAHRADRIVLKQRGDRLNDGPRWTAAAGPGGRTSASIDDRSLIGGF